MLLNAELRNRNPLHASLIDATIIGNLMNFPKHIFGFPYACYATDGNESLSLCLYAHRQVKLVRVRVRVRVRVKVRVSGDLPVRMVLERLDSLGEARPPLRG